jgi:phosphoribosylanthranilate isomerase
VNLQDEHTGKKMSGVRVKICGLTRIEDVTEAIAGGADALGFIFGYNTSPRNLSFEKLENLTREVPPFVSVVVVSPASNPELAGVIRDVRPSFLQLSSQDKEKEYQPGYRSNVIETVHVALHDNQREDDLISRCRKLSNSSIGILLDSVSIEPNTNVTLGGTGLRHDWNQSRRIRDALYPFPVILAGGLNEQNVQRAIREVKPFAVDVSSGVEARPGIKDKFKVRKFIQNAKAG